MPRSVQYLCGTLILALLIGGPIAYARHQYHECRNFRVVDEGVLYRSGQMSLDGLKRVIRDYGIKTVVTLRDTRVPGEPPPDFDEEGYCASQGLHYFRIPLRNPDSSTKLSPMDEGVKNFRAIMANKENRPVLVHCLAGIHRTGTFCAIYRMEFDHWTIGEAVAEMKTCGYDKIEDKLDVMGYLEQCQLTSLHENKPKQGKEEPSDKPDRELKRKIPD